MSEKKPKHLPTIADIIDKYEIPRELHSAIWDAYEAGFKKGFLEGSIQGFNIAVKDKV